MGARPRVTRALRRAVAVAALAALAVLRSMVGEAQPQRAPAAPEVLAHLRAGGTAWIRGQGSGYVVLARRPDLVLAASDGLWAWRARTTERAAWVSPSAHAPLVRRGVSAVTRATLERIDRPTARRVLHAGRFEMGCETRERVEVTAVRDGLVEYQTTRERRCGATSPERTESAAVVDVATAHESAASASDEALVRRFARDEALLGWSHVAPEGCARERQRTAFAAR